MPIVQNAAYIRDPLQLTLDRLPARQTALTTDLDEGSLPVWANEQGTRAGYWECTPGEFTLHCDGYAEICQILKGRLTVQERDRELITLQAGDTLVMPSGWLGTWRVLDPVRKLFVVVPDTAKAR